MSCLRAPSTEIPRWMRRSFPFETEIENASRESEQLQEKEEEGREKANIGEKIETELRERDAGCHIFG